jgi:hypothetical protein
MRGWFVLVHLAYGIGAWGRAKSATNDQTMMTDRRKPQLAESLQRRRPSSSRASFMKLLLSVALMASAVAASACEVWAGSEMLPDALPPTTLVVSSPSASSSPMSVGLRPDLAVPVKLAADAKPSIIWHLVDGRWHWHCVAHCETFRSRDAGPGEAATEFYKSSAN